VEGHEGFYDTLSINGEPVYDFVTHYYPNVLDAMRTRWVSPQFVATNRVDSVPEYGEVRAMGRRVARALGIGTSATHMEWFFGPKGLRFNEIGCRPPGVRAWDLYAAGNDVDIYREWANVIVHGRVERPLSRRRAAGMVALRPDPGWADQPLRRRRRGAATLRRAHPRRAPDPSPVPRPSRWTPATWPTPGCG